MSRKRKWTTEQLKNAVKESFSVAQIIKKLGLVAAGGNYAQMHQYIKELNIDTSNFTGMGWRKGNATPVKTAIPLKMILTKNSTYQTYKLKRRLWSAGLKPKQCELCGWCNISEEGHLPLELDHMNGDRYDHRLKNLRILCPNCHSLQPTHRGRNLKNANRGRWRNRYTHDT